VIVGDELLADDPELVRAFTAAVAAAQADVIADPELGFAAAEAAVPTISEDPETARAILDATVELWEGDGFADGAVDRDLWVAGYETIVRLGFIDGSVEIDEMLADVSGG
jgi:ABC-type nitrate/sulfonate/bicarbonate transport system substrate-binding protein